MKGLPKEFSFFHGLNLQIYSVGDNERFPKLENRRFTNNAIQVTTNPSLKDMLEYSLYLKHKLYLVQPDVACCWSHDILSLLKRDLRNI